MSEEGNTDAVIDIRIMYEILGSYWPESELIYLVSAGCTGASPVISFYHNIHQQKKSVLRPLRTVVPPPRREIYLLILIHAYSDCSYERRICA